MGNVKILHCADLHFDTPFSDLSSVEASKRKEELRETFGRIIEISREEKVDIIIISGDLFDNSSVIKTTIDYMFKVLEKVPDIHVFIAPGNHDPFFERSFYKIIQWPENVHVFSGDFEKFELKHLGTCVYGIGFTKPHIRETLIEGFSVEDDGAINLMVLHGEVINSGQDSDYNPINEEHIRNSGLDYLALGHKHSFSGIKKSGKTYWAYSGNPEGRGFDELGPKGVIIGNVGKDYAELHFRELCKRQYLTKCVDVSGSLTYEEIILKIDESFGLHAMGEDLEDIISTRKRNLYKIFLTGELSEDFSLNTSIIEEKLKDKFYYLKLIDNTSIELDYENLAKEYSIKGIFVKKLMERIKNTEDEAEIKRLTAALRFGIGCLEDREVELD